MPLPRHVNSMSRADGTLQKFWLSVTDDLDAFAEPLEPTGGCGGCGTSRPGEKPPEIVVWLGVRWIGTPWPKRWRRGVDRRGCGCILKLKALRYVLSRIMRMTALHLRAWKET